MAFLTTLLPLLQLAMELGLKYGPDFTKLFDRSLKIANGDQPTDADFTALHVMRDKIDAERHRIEEEARK